MADQLRKGLSEAQWEREQEREGRLSIAEIARCQSRYFVEGAVLGSREWVDEVIEGIKGDFLSESRKTLSSKMRGALDGCGLWSMRKLE
ncbi:hypothetical protein [Rubritalea tangerina]|uniref:Uncharacterized protein n=1 Tax=Rubritalea tangerina TaxID=430798 RepID=A0ABW4ZEJ9_9BACT